MTVLDTKKYISTKTDIKYKFYDNDKYIGIILENKSDLNKFIKFLKDDKSLLFNQLIDISAIDFPSREYRFDVFYLFSSLTKNQRILIKISIKVDDFVESITPLYFAANWYERECYDLFGIQFQNHPDLRRIMTDYNFEGHPLRKDFPLTGHNEVRYDDLEKKVVYEKVNLQQEYRNFDYQSPWEGLENQLIGDEKAEKENK
tara:strand:+ start:390 stop:995 length:606 start_codon:yes stop_codon:yes gene_type:complete